MSESDLATLPGGALAYLGDAVFEVTVRRALLSRGITSPGALNREALNYVTAVAQSRAMEKILPLLEPDEADVFRRGRNAGDLTPAAFGHARRIPPRDRARGAVRLPLPQGQHGAYRRIIQSRIRVK